MIIILIGAVFLVGASVALVARAVAMPRVRAAETIGQIDAYGYAGQRWRRPHWAGDSAGLSTSLRAWSAASSPRGSAGLTKPSCGTS